MYVNASNTLYPYSHDIPPVSESNNIVLDLQNFYAIFLLTIVYLYAILVEVSVEWLES